MELRFLDVFCKVFELKSFSRAADKLLLTQPTISAHIKSLELDLDLVLFDRMGREVLPTKAGLLLYRYASEIGRLNREARQAVSRLSGKLSGRLEVGGSTIPGEYLLPYSIGRFRQKCPDVIVRLNVADSRDIATMVLDGKVELGVVGANVQNSQLESRELSEDELILIAAPGFPFDEIPDEKISGLPFITREKGSGSWESLEKAFVKKGLNADKLNIVAEMGSTEAVKSGVRSGLGLSVVSMLAVKEDLARGSLKSVKIQGLPIQRKIYVVTHRLKTKSPVCEAFIEFLFGN
ncbi:MAG: LysR family transcriptional regulator [Proteobacteria bacterium]|nr:LysR family transcriptional regulator [Pseudomonadota bacterium]